MKTVTKHLFILTMFAALAILLMGADSSCGTKKADAPATGPGSAAEPLKVEPAALVAEFDANKITAQDKYNGKVVQTSGFIKNISSASDNFYLQINPTSDQYYLGTSFQCYVSKADASAVANGQQIAFKGTVQDVTVTLIQMKDCSVVK